MLAAALQGGTDPNGNGVGLGCDLRRGVRPVVRRRPAVSNSEGFDCAACDLKTAMTKSINTVFYRMAMDVGPPDVIDAAHQAGIPGDLLPELRGGIALGDQEVHPIDMASAYATFAADGKRHPPYIVAKVTTADGRVLIDRTDDAANQTSQAMSQQVARNVTESLLGVAGSSNIELTDGRTVAVKTGTVQLPGTRDQNKDAWAVGYTPSISTAVWVGSDASDSIRDASGRPIFGRMVPGSIWKEYMSSALRGTSAEAFSTFVPLGLAPSASDSDDEDSDSSDEDKDDKDDEDKDNDKKDKKDKSDDDEDSNNLRSVGRIPGLTGSDPVAPGLTGSDPIGDGG